MLRALYEHGIAPDVLVGTSAGALNAAFVASRPQTVATAEELARVWRGLHRDDIFPINPRTLIGGPANQRDHLVPNRGCADSPPGARRIHVLPTEDPLERTLPIVPRGALDAAVHAFTLLVGARLRTDIARYATRAELIVLPCANTERVQPTDFDHSSRLIATALAAARTALAAGSVAEPAAA
jgi:predicted acylesterase/phospholipase RssA